MGGQFSIADQAAAPAAHRVADTAVHSARKAEHQGSLLQDAGQCIPRAARPAVRAEHQAAVQDSARRAQGLAHGQDSERGQVPAVQPEG